jgi:hypothetical protein
MLYFVGWQECGNDLIVLHRCYPKDYVMFVKEFRRLSLQINI